MFLYIHCKYLVSWGVCVAILLQTSCLNCRLNRLSGRIRHMIVNTAHITIANPISAIPYGVHFSASVGNFAHLESPVFMNYCQSFFGYVL
jgi:hypothetical protein